ncbi:DUF445 family protein [Deferribacteraceae bacterium V6Fe1]|nr:DUF445 family protein [Deferribacteraceae bacterium V6Fe1]
MFLTAGEIATPFVTGFVGYFTNYLAIKMLFRPHKREWYSFGWQGVIPRNRSKLAKEVGNLVGNNLLTEKDILNSLKKEEFQIYLQSSIRKELRDILSKDFGELSLVLEKIGINSKDAASFLYNKLILNEELFESLINVLLQSISELRISDFFDLEESLKKIAENVFKDTKWKSRLIKEVSAYLNNIILSGVSLRQAMPESFYTSILSISENMTLKVLEYIKKISEDEEVKEKIVQKLIEIKNNSFKGGVFDQLKLGMLNLFLNEDVIRDLVKSKFPEIVQNISGSDEIKDKISGSIKEKIVDILNKPIYKLIEKFKVEDFYSLKTFFEGKLLDFMNSRFLVEKIKYIISANAQELNNLRLNDIFKIIGGDSLGLNHRMQLFDKLKQDKVKEVAISNIALMIGKIKITNIYDKISQKSFRQSVDFLTGEINELLNRNVAPILQALDVKNIVEDKINSLNLYEVEDMLFSFMSEQFKWINILGFVLGFIFGVIQIMIFKII